MILPPLARPLLDTLAPAFTRPTFRRFVVLLAATILTHGRHTVANLLRTLGGLAPGHRTDYQRVLSRAPWSGLRLGCALARFIVDRLCPTGPVLLVGDDTVDGHPGRRVYGKARHRDPVRSTHSHTAWRYGHKWVVLAVLVRFPFAARPWTLPVLVDLYRAPKDNRRRQRPHRTPAQLMCRLLRLMLLRFPSRHFLFVGDAGYGTHEVARFCYRHRARLTLVSKLHPEANLLGPPPPSKGRGRPPVKGPRRPKPREAVPAARRLTRLSLAWYGGGTRRVETVTGTGHWFQSGHGLVPIRWAFVRDRDGTHRDEYFFSTDTALSVAVIIAHYTSRWNIETTFQHNLPVLLFLINNHGYTIEVEIHDGPYNNIKNWDYAALIEAFNAGEGNGRGLRATNGEELAEAIRKAAANTTGPTLIECVIDRDDCSRELISWGRLVATANAKPPRQS